MLFEVALKKILKKIQNKAFMVSGFHLNGHIILQKFESSNRSNGSCSFVVHGILPFKQRQLTRTHHEKTNSVT